jgi:hypothetical protein
MKDRISTIDDERYDRITSSSRSVTIANLSLNLLNEYFSCIVRVARRNKCCDGRYQVLSRMLVMANEKYFLSKGPRDEFVLHVTWSDHVIFKGFNERNFEKLLSYNVLINCGC